ncbi:hypothetical protein KY290_010671 [Solanum tuberosum]|uniref:Plasmodium variant antigen protein Cir/Yir/Bir n=1 Tax=Solanum tuberosum TaxID=4113 RepID=A0ABQ7W0L6_SOLTU|nr:hypothetical protein KY290_010671 [Solanum tuberosum]
MISPSKKFSLGLLLLICLLRKNNNQDEQDYDLQPDHGKHGIGNPNDDIYSLEQNEEQSLVLWAKLLMKKDDHTITEIPTRTTTSSYMLVEENNNQDEQDHDLQPDHGKHGIGNPSDDTYSFGLFFLKLLNGKSSEKNEEQSLVLWAEFLMKKDDIITKILTLTSYYMLAEENNNLDEQDYDMQPDHGKHQMGNPIDDTYSFGLLFLKLFNEKSSKQNEEQSLMLWSKFLMKKYDHTIT